MQYKKLSGSNLDIIPNVWYGGGKIFDNIVDTGIGDSPYYPTIKNNNDFSVKVLIWKTSSKILEVYSVASNEMEEVTNQSGYTKIAVMKNE